MVGDRLDADLAGAAAGRARRRDRADGRDAPARRREAASDPAPVAMAEDLCTRSCSGEAVADRQPVRGRRTRGSGAAATSRPTLRPARARAPRGADPQPGARPRAGAGRGRRGRDGGRVRRRRPDRRRGRGLRDTDGVLGVLPGGRGNDFARALGIPLDLGAACEVLRGRGRRARSTWGWSGTARSSGSPAVGSTRSPTGSPTRRRSSAGNLVYAYGGPARPDPLAPGRRSPSASTAGRPASSPRSPSPWPTPAATAAGCCSPRRPGSTMAGWTS